MMWKKLIYDYMRAVAEKKMGKIICETSCLEVLPWNSKQDDTRFEPPPPTNSRTDDPNNIIALER